MINTLIRVMRKPGFWILVALLAFITVPHWQETLQHPSFLTQLFGNLGLTRHSFERILYLAPIVWAGFLFGWIGAFVISLAAFASMLPHAILLAPDTVDAVFEVCAVFVLGNVLAISFSVLRKERESRAHLFALNQTSNVVSQSLDLDWILGNSIDNVMSVMKLDAALVFLLNEETNELILSAYQGISQDFAQEIDKLKLGEGFNGRVAETGEPLFVADVAQDPRLTRQVLKSHEIHSEIIVPLRSKEKVCGTLCAASHRARWFQQDEIELLTAIGNQIGVAVENARLYQKQQDITGELRTSEERYRDLFESSIDAIWLHDLEDNILAANKSLVRLTGYTLEEIHTMKASDLIADDCISTVKDVEAELLKGETEGHISELTLIKKDNSEATVQLSNSPIFKDNKIAGFQHIARDVTQQKRMQENLRFYTEQVTKAQEEERKRISRELHDETVQALVVLSRQLDSLASNGQELSVDNQKLLEDLRQQSNDIMQGVRRLSQDLRPVVLESLGLPATMEWLAADVKEYSGIDTAVEIIGEPRRLSEEKELVLFRISQEALRNIWRHSQATTAQVTVEFDEGKTRLSIKDNGKGFNLPQTIGDLAKEGKLGLAGMQERARLIGGTLSVQSKPGKGTTVTVELPYSHLD